MIEGQQNITQSTFIAGLLLARLALAPMGERGGFNPTFTLAVSIVF